MRILLVALFAATATLFAVPAEGSQAAAVTKRLAVVVIQNGDTPGEQKDLADVTFLRNIFLGSSNSLVTWTTAVTRGQLTFAPAGDGLYAIPPSAELRDADPAGCHTGLAKATAQDYLKSRGVTWDSLAMVYDIAGCGWGGLGTVPGPLTWYPPRPSLAAIVHELGHNHGYPHENKRDCAEGKIAACNGDGECCSGNTPMGGGGDGRGYSSVELMHSGWLDPAAKVLATKPGTFNLKPLYGDGPGTRVVEYKVNSSLSYVVETRAPAGGVDAKIDNPGVRVYAVTNGKYVNAPMINPGLKYVPAGTAITDTANKLRIAVRSSSISGAIVAIEAISTPPSARPAPSPTPSPEPSPSPVLSHSEDPLPDNAADLLDVSDGEPVPKKSKAFPLLLFLFGLLLGVAVLIVGARVFSRKR